MSKLWRVIGDNATEQVLLETSAENVTVADTGEKLEATTVEGALNELADSVNELRRANIIDVGQGIPTTQNGDTITPVNFKFSDGTNKTVNIYAKQGATGAKIVSTDLIGHTDGGDNIYQQTFDNGSKARFIAPKGDSGVDDYEELKSKPIIYAILNAISDPVENTYYKHVGATTERFINGYIYLYTGGEYKAIDGSGSGGGGAASITYTKLSGDVEFTSTSPSASSAFFVNTNVATWAVNETIERKALASESDLGLVIGNSYTMEVHIDGTSYTFSGTADDGTEYGLPGRKILGLVNESRGGFTIYDHCDFIEGYPKADNGAIIISGLSPTPNSAMITNFSGGLQIVSPATITNSAIKVNSSVTMYINSDITVRGTKTDGSITLSASEVGRVSYEMEIHDVTTEGLFKIINGYVPEIQTQQQADWEQTDDTAVDYIKNKPTIPTIPTNLPQTAESVARQTWAKGETTIEVSDSSITYNSDIDIILSCEEVITGYSDIGKFTLRANSALTKNIEFEYKIKQTSGFGQMNIINNYRIPRDKFSANYLKVKASVHAGDWVASSEYSQYPYQAEISITALKYLKDRFPVKPVKSIDTITADIVFDVKEALSGIFAPVCSVVKPKSDDEQVKVRIYASEDMTNYAYDYIIIPTIKLTFEGDCGV